MNQVEIGKINEVRFGSGGYQDAMIGFTFQLGGKSWGTGDFWGFWSMDPTSSAEWTAEKREIALGKTVMRVQKLMEQAKVQDFTKLKNIPVEVKFEDNTLKSWRILEEVL
jgi:hypothetical protein